jgi:hypothetical protein
MVYYALPVNYDHLVCGCLILLACTITAVHIYRGSRAEYAITLIAFAFGFGLYNVIGGYLVQSFNYNFYLTTTSKFIYYMLYV